MIRFKILLNPTTKNSHRFRDIILLIILFFSIQSKAKCQSIGEANKNKSELKSKYEDNIKGVSQDSFAVLLNNLKYNLELEYHELDSLLTNLKKLGDIHYYVIENLGTMPRTPIHHEYYPGFMTFVCENMDSIYKSKIIEKINRDELERHLAYPILKYCVFENKSQTCEFLISLGLETKNEQSNSLLYESLIKLKKEMQCSVDSFEIIKNQLNGYHYKEDFYELLNLMEKYGDPHEHVLENLTRNIFTPLHDFYPGYLNYAFSNLDAIYRDGIINKYLGNELNLSETAFFVSRFFDKNIDICNYLSSKILECDKGSKKYKNIADLIQKVKCSM